MTRGASAFVVTVTGLLPPWDMGDVVNLKVVASDADTVTNSPLVGTVTLLNNIRFRSMGYNNTNALACGTTGGGCTGTGNMSIVGSNATFAGALPNIIGVGDGIQYDSDGNGSIDSIAFIHQRVSSTQYTVKATNGAVPTAVTNDQDWSIFRAFTTSLKALGGTENTAFNATVRDFDNGTFKNLTTNTYIRAIALYDDAEEINNSGLQLTDTGYTTNSSYYIKLFTPYLPTEVGRSMRHTGAWFGPGYMYVMGTGGEIALNKDYAWIEGLKIETWVEGGCPIFFGGVNHTIIDNFITYDGLAYNPNPGKAPVGIYQSNVSLPVVMVNNIFANFKAWDPFSPYWVGSAVDIGYADSWAYSSTIVNSEEGIAGYNGNPSNLYAKNNLVQNSTTPYNVDTGNFMYWGANSNNNISNTAVATNGTANQTNITDVAFLNKVDMDYRLASTDVRATNAGANLSTDSKFPYSDDALGNARGSTWDIGAIEYSASDNNKVALMKINAITNSDNSFTASAYTTGDENNNSTAVLWYCNNTDSSGCVPTSGSQVSMTKRGSGGAVIFYATVTDLATPNDPLDTLNLRVVISDSDGVITDTYKNTTVTLDATVLYRSLGTNSSVKATGAGNNLTIAGTNATFGSSLANNIGIGDAIQYDSDNNGSIDDIAFIKKRISATSYIVQSKTGGTPTATSVADQDWSIYRAYTSMANAAAGTENTNIDAAVVNFDTWSGGTNLSTANNSFYLVAYNDGTNDSAASFTTTWVTAANKRIKIFTPVTSSEVGTSQRHAGTWASGGYTIVGCDALVMNQSFVQIEGLLVEMDSTTNGCTGIQVPTQSGTVEVKINNNIIRRTAASGTGQKGVEVIGAGTPSSYTYFWNNIVYGFSSNTSSCLSSADMDALYANNTVYNCYYGFYVINTANTILYANNIAQNIASANAIYDQTANGRDGIGYNIVPDYYGVSTRDYILNTNVTFVNTGSDDYRLSGSDTVAKDMGFTFISDIDSDLPFINLDDIEGNARPQGSHWSVGASDK